MLPGFTLEFLILLNRFIRGGWEDNEMHLTEP